MLPGTLGKSETLKPGCITTPGWDPVIGVACERPLGDRQAGRPGSGGGDGSTGPLSLPLLSSARSAEAGGTAACVSASPAMATLTSSASADRTSKESVMAWRKPPAPTRN